MIAGTKVWKSDGSTERVEHLNVGDSILTIHRGKMSVMSARITGFFIQEICKPLMLNENQHAQLMHEDNGNNNDTSIFTGVLVGCGMSDEYLKKYHFKLYGIELEKGYDTCIIGEDKLVIPTLTRP